MSSPWPSRGGTFELELIGDNFFNWFSLSLIHSMQPHPKKKIHIRSQTLPCSVLLVFSGCVFSWIWQLEIENVAILFLFFFFFREVSCLQLSMCNVVNQWNLNCSAEWVLERCSWNILAFTTILPVHVSLFLCARLIDRTTRNIKFWS